MTEKDTHPSSTHPPLPPTSEVEQFSRLRLLRSRRVGVSTFKRLLAEYGTAQNALAALPNVARAAGAKSYEPCSIETVQSELNAAARAGAQLVAQDNIAYPPLLAELDDAPPFLWVIGDPAFLLRPLISIVGARNASSLGVRMAQTLARDLGEAGYVVVSGLARGIDAASHSAALERGTIAVQAGGVDTIYPEENRDLAEQIAGCGLRISEQPMGLRPIARHFPSRNRIISGLSRATIIVEAAPKSGSLITARDALDQGRDVLAVPGHPFDARAAGCNALIREGAPLIRSAQDVIDFLAPFANVPAPFERPPRSVAPKRAEPPKKPEKTWDMAAIHKKVLQMLGPSPVAEDQLIRDLNVSPSQVAPVLIDLELDGKIERQPGGLLTKT